MRESVLKGSGTPGDRGWSVMPSAASRHGVGLHGGWAVEVLYACPFGRFVGAFAQDQQDFRAVPFHAPHRRHRQVSRAVAPSSEKRLRPEIAALQDQHTPRSASLTTPQPGHSQLGSAIPPNRRSRTFQSSHV